MVKKYKLLSELNIKTLASGFKLYHQTVRYLIIQI